MPSVDERVVAMSFENARFEAKVAATMGSLEKLDASIKNVGRTSGLDRLERQGDRVTFEGPMRALDSLQHKFSIVQGAAAVAFGNIATMAATRIGGLAKSLTLDPIMTGFQNYATNLNSIQTILANTADSGGNLKTVTAALDDMNKYANLTIYDFSQMARNVGTFTAAGVRLGPAVESIKGIANLAALSGSNSEQASSAMYQLSQAIAAGRVGLQDWNSVVNAGMGGAVFQKALMRTGESMGTIAKNAYKVDKATGKATINGESFRQSIQAKPGQTSWLTADVLTKTLAQFTGDLSDAQLKAQGFNAEQIKAIQLQARNARNAATQVKTVGQLFDVMKESIASGWAQSFKLVIGNFDEARSSLTAISNVFSGIISSSAEARNKILGDWRKLGGRTELIKGIKVAFDDLRRALKPIRQAFREFFPAQTGRDLMNMTRNFTNLMRTLRPSNRTVNELRRIFAGIFAVLHIGIAVVKDVTRMFLNLFRQTGAGSGGFLKFAARIGDTLVNLDKFLVKGGALERFFDRLTVKLTKPIDLLKRVAAAIGGVFGVGDSSGINSFSDGLDVLNRKLNPFRTLIEGASKAWQGFTTVIGKVKAAISPLLTQIGDIVADFGSIVANAIRNADYNKVFAAVNTVLIAGIFLAIKKAIGGGVKVDFGGGILKNISNTFETLTGNLKTMQRNIQVKTIMEIAAALVILAAAVVILSTIDPKKLATAMTALAVGLGELVGAMGLLNKAAGGATFIKMPAIGAGLVLLAGAMILMAVAAKIFATMSWEEISKGLAAVTGMLVGITAATQMLNPVKMVAAGAAMIPIALAISILAGATELFARMKWEGIGKGLAAIGGMLLGIGIAMNAFPPTAALMGPSLVLIAVAVDMLAGAVEAFGHMDPKALAFGILGIAGALAAIGLAIDTIPPTVALQAAGLLILAAALAGISGVVLAFGKMDTRTVARGIALMGAALLVLAAGLALMEGSLPGSLALLAAAAAFTVLAPALILMGQISWTTLLHGLVAMAAVIAVLAVAGLIAGPAMVILGVGLAAVGAGLLLIGSAMYLFAKGLSLLSDTGVKAFAALLTAITLFIAAFPQLVINFVKGVIETLDAIVKLAPKIIAALINITGQLLDAIIALAPKAAVAIEVLITQILKVINTNAQPLIKAGFSLLQNLLAGIANNIGQVTTNVALIIIRFLDALADKLPGIVAGGLRVLIGFLRGISSGIPRLAATVTRLIVTFLNNITKHIPEIVTAAVSIITSFVSSLANQIPRVITAAVSIITNFLTGIQQNIPRVIAKALALARTFVTNLAKGLVKLVDIGAQAIIDFLNGLARVIRKREPEIMKAGYNVATAIGDGMLQGLKDIAPHLYHRVTGIAHNMLNKVTGVFSIGSPSKIMHEIGRNVMLGLANGIDQQAPEVNSSIATSARNAVKTAKQQFAQIPAALEHINPSPVIKPILDLSHVKKTAPQLKNMLDVAPLGVTSRDTAATIALQQRNLKLVPDAKAPTVHFQQNNYSPEALSNIEIYRQTHNQISRVKSLLQAS